MNFRSIYSKNYISKILDIQLTATGTELKKLLEEKFDVGTVSVTEYQKCYSYKWKVKWLTKPGKQILLQVNTSKLFGNKVKFTNRETEGGLFYEKIPGEFLRMPTKEPQVRYFHPESHYGGNEHSNVLVVYSIHHH